jgi:DNA invertase Pin-like site-specific DNA recombinase
MVRHRERRVGLYLRVSTSEQTTKNQRRELETAAKRHGWLVVSVFEDAGNSRGQRTRAASWARRPHEGGGAPGD